MRRNIFTTSLVIYFTVGYKCSHLERQRSYASGTQKNVQRQSIRGFFAFASWWCWCMLFNFLSSLSRSSAWALSPHFSPQSIWWSVGAWNVKSVWVLFFVISVEHYQSKWLHKAWYFTTETNAKKHKTQHRQIARHLVPTKIEMNALFSIKNI